MLKKYFRFVMVMTVATIVVVSGALAQSASARDNVATATVSSLSALQEDLCKVAALIDPSYPLLIQMSLGQTAALGVDTAKPIMLCVNPSEDGLGFAAFIPVTSQKMVEANIASLREKGTFKEEWKVTIKDGYAVLTDGAEWESDIPEIKTKGLLSVSMKPAVFAPILATVATAMRPDDAEEIATVQKSWGQIENFDFTLNITEDGSIQMNTIVEPKADTDITKLYVACEKLSKTMLGSFYDAEAPVAGQMLTVFAEHERLAKILDKAQTSEELRDVILKAMNVEKFDGAFSFYSDDKGVYGVYAMGINDGAGINDLVAKAIADGDLKGTANVDKIGKSITIHEIDAHETVKVALGVHAKYLFVAVSANGSDPVQLMKKTFKERPLKAGTVEKNGDFHFDMSILAPYAPQVSDLKGQLKSSGSFKNGVYNSNVTVDSDLLLSVGKIYAAFKKAKEGDDVEEDEIFGEDEE